jgi:hypothetical protein
MTCRNPGVRVQAYGSLGWHLLENHTHALGTVSAAEPHDLVLVLCRRWTSKYCHGVYVYRWPIHWNAHSVAVLRKHLLPRMFTLVDSMVGSGRC